MAVILKLSETNVSKNVGKIGKNCILELVTMHYCMSILYFADDCVRYRPLFPQTCKFAEPWGIYCIKSICKHLQYKKMKFSSDILSINF